jgi:hypothetical protein
MKKTHHCHHATRWSSNGEDLKPKDTRCNAPKTTRSRSSTYSDQFTRSFCSHQFLHNLKGEQQDIFGYLKPHEVTLPTNQESSQSEVPKSGYGRITEGCTFWNFWTTCKNRNKTAVTPSFGLRLRWMSTRWKGNFIKFSMEQYFCICSVIYTGENLQKRGSSNMMRTR